MSEMYNYSGSKYLGGALGLRIFLNIGIPFVFIGGLLTTQSGYIFTKVLVIINAFMAILLLITGYRYCNDIKMAKLLKYFALVSFGFIVLSVISFVISILGVFRYSVPGLIFFIVPISILLIINTITFIFCFIGARKNEEARKKEGEDFVTFSNFILNVIGGIKSLIGELRNEIAQNRANEKARKKERNGFVTFWLILIIGMGVFSLFMRSNNNTIIDELLNLNHPFYLIQTLVYIAGAILLLFWKMVGFWIIVVIDLIGSFIFGFSFLWLLLYGIKDFILFGILNIRKNGVSAWDYLNGTDKNKTNNEPIITTQTKVNSNQTHEINQEIRYCIKCGSKLAAGSNFCSHCGFNLTTLKDV